MVGSGRPLAVLAGTCLWPAYCKRFPTPAIDKLPDDIRTIRCRKIGLRANVFLTLAYRPDEFALLCLSRRADGKGRRPDQGRARDDRGGDLERQPVPLLRDRARRHPAHPRQEPADRGSDRRQLSQGGYHATPARHARLRDEGEHRGQQGFGSDFAAVASHGFSDDDIWDIAAIAAFFALSNRMANVTAMRPNDEFYMMGRLPK
jgi:hypothetical protein